MMRYNRLYNIIIRNNNKKYHNLSFGIYRKNYVMPYKYFMPVPDKPTKYNDVATLIKEEMNYNDDDNNTIDEYDEKELAIRKEELNKKLEEANSIDDITDVLTNHYNDVNEEEKRVEYITNRIESRHVDPLTPSEYRELSWYAEKIIKKYDTGDKQSKLIVNELLKPKYLYQRIDALRALPLEMNIYFDKFDKSLENYNQLLEVHALKGNIASAREVLDQMKYEGFVPNGDSYAALIHTAGKLREKDISFNIFNEMERNNVLPNQVVFAELIYACVRKHKFAEAYKVFDMVREREMKTTEAMYYALLKGLYDDGHYKRADEVYLDMWKDNVEPTAPTMELMMKVAGKLKLPERAFIHETQMNSFDDPIEMNLPLYNAMIFAYASRSDTTHKAFLYFDRMINLTIVPNHDTFHNLLLACETNNDLNTADSVMKMMSKFELKPTMETKKILLNVIASSQRFVKQEVNGHVLSQTDRIQLAIDLLENTDEQEIDVDFLNHILLCHTKPCHIQKALKFFHEAYKHYDIKGDFTTYSHLFRMATKSKRLLLAEYLKEMMNLNNIKMSLGLYRQLLYLHGKLGQFKKAEYLIKEMEDRDLLKKLPENERLFALGEPVVLSELYDQPSPRLKATKIISNMPLLAPRNRKKRKESQYVFADDR